MITVLHGDDTENAYKRLSSLQDTHKDFIKVRLGSKTTQEELLQALQTEDLLGTPKLIIVENFLSPFKKLPDKLFEKIPKESSLIFWENKPLSDAKVKKLQKIAKLEYFKKPTELFVFLDNLFPGSKLAFSLLPALSKEEGLLWQIQNRLLLLTLCKFNISTQTLNQVTKRPLAPWQWQKIEIQSAKFDKKILLLSFHASLKIDNLIKSGKTALPAQTLIAMFITKYLKATTH